MDNSNKYSKNMSFQVNLLPLANSKGFLGSDSIKWAGLNVVDSEISGTAKFSGKIVLSGSNIYGTAFPSGAEVGQIFFKTV